MASWRELKRSALADIHRAFEIPAVYLTHAAGTPVRVNVRLHQKQIISEQMIDDWTSAGKLLDMTDRIVFDTKEVAKVLGKSYVIFGNSEAYLTGPTKPERDGYIYAEVSEVSQADLTAFLDTVDTTGPEWEGILT
ncbi:hypothetical protein [Manganibacter manganicus]|uniref:Uncharacterized protein n=1 Tax=Manganibacter manganicus TaxID=1873176 RepID=A0A1V8RR45_9HYPH|nr:hypothetical protein [Pseudaminobacter manganicus]OQM75594.1 hypothetical protein BFN67_17635 [Pseudaminobacter manganicus]